MAAIIFCISSCSVYTPNVLNTPMLREKGDASISAHLGNGANLQASYALSNNIGLLTNFMAVNSEVDVDNGDNRKGKGSLYEIGLGYFSARPEKSGIFELYGGVGLGKVDIDKTIFNANNQVRTFEANATRFFIQPSIGSAGKIFEIALSSRFAFLKYNNVKTTYTIDDLEADNFVDIDDRSWMFIEPALTLRAGFPRFKAQLQIGRSIKLNNEELGYDPGFVNVGLVGRF